MAINRLKITQPNGQDPKIVAFTDDILLNGLTGNGLITVTGSGKEKTVSTDASKLTLDNDKNVKVATPLVLDVKTEAPSTPTNALYAVKDGTENKLYWNGKLVDAHEVGEGYVTETEFKNTIGEWTTISGKTVKAAIEDDLSLITAGTSGTGVTVTIGSKSDKSQSVAVSVQDGTTSQKGIVQLAGTHSDSDTSNAATGKTVASAISTYDANTIGSWTDGGKYSTMAVKSAIESLAAVSMFKVVEELPRTGETNTIYIVKPSGKTEGPYEEWIWVDNKWEKIGDTDIQLTDYYKKTEIGTGFDTTNTVKKYIEDQDADVKDTSDGADDTSDDGHVKVELTGTVGNHGLTVTTSDIASAAALTALTGRVTTAEGDIDAVETKLAGITGTVKAYVDAEASRATTAEGGLNTRLTTAEGEIATNTQQITANTTAIANETSRATTAESGLNTRLGVVEGKLASLTTEAKGNLVAAINEVNTNADAAQTAADNAQSAADAAQSTANTAQSTANTNSTAIGTLTNLTTDAKNNLVAAINEVNTTAGSAVKTAEGDANINASVSGTKVTVGVKADSNLADLLSCLSIVEEQ